MLRIRRAILVQGPDVRLINMVAIALLLANVAQTLMSGHSSTSASLIEESQATATHSISISNSIGHDATGTKLRAGGLTPKYLA